MAQTLVDMTFNDGDTTIVVDPDTDNALLDGKCIAAAAPKLAVDEKDATHSEASQVEPSIQSDGDISEIATPAPMTNGMDDKGEKSADQAAAAESGSKTATLTICRHLLPTIDLSYSFSGQNFVVPFDACQTWADLKETIKLFYEGDELSLKLIENDQYTVLQSNSKVLPQFWPRVADLAVQLDVHLKEAGAAVEDDHEAKIDDKAEKEEDEQPVAYNLKVKYRVDYFSKSRYRTLGNDFICSTAHDAPVILGTTHVKEKEPAVLEEIKTIIFATGTKVPSSFEIEQSAPSLGASDAIGPKKLHICSPLLLNALRAVVKHTFNAPSGDETDPFSDGIFVYPFPDLYHAREDLREYQALENVGAKANHTPEYNQTCNDQIDLLLDYLNAEPGMGSLETRWKRKVPMTTFGGFWLLMKPGIEVYSEEEGQLNAFVVDSVSGGVDATLNETRPYSIRVWNLVFDGKKIVRIPRVIDVPVFDNEREIMSLPIFPARFQDQIDGGKRRGELIARGHKYFEYSKGPKFLQYTGVGLKRGWKKVSISLAANIIREADLEKYKYARVVVEHESLPWTSKEFANSNKMEPWTHFSSQCTDVDCNICKKRRTIGERARIARCECGACLDTSQRTENEVFLRDRFADFDNLDPKKLAILTDDQAFLCDSHMFGFVLKDRVHDLLDITGLDEPQLAQNAIDRLVMKPENKETIKAIVQTYADNADDHGARFSADYIQGKGEGQVFLLHGPPGTGKTLTAESVAEYTKRPLLSITAADLGHEPTELETNLLRFFRNATNWDAIVLLDEADVYLEARSPHDLERNSAVSIFLRALDYFQGILFLTTNRVGQFDEAFMSRIHVSIAYDPLNDAARKEIWSGLYRKLEEDHKRGGELIMVSPYAQRYIETDDVVQALKWNGREIRNAFQTAVALAMFDSKKERREREATGPVTIEMERKHFEQVVTMSSAFKDYLKNFRGMDEDDYAYKQKIRMDRSKSVAEPSFPPFTRSR